MSWRYEMIYGFVHCRGRTTYHAGFTDEKEVAETWARNHRSGLSPKMKIPREDPLRHCRAAWCPFKRQQPWFDFLSHKADAP